MGNCQAAESVTVVIQRPGGAIQRIYWSISANEVMASNPGHYVAVVTVSARSENGMPVKKLKLLRPDDTLHIGHVYRLVSFEDVLKEFAVKRYPKLNRGTTEKSMQEEEVCGLGSSGRSLGVPRHRQWKPKLQSIAEVGS